MTDNGVVGRYAVHCIRHGYRWFPDEATKCQGFVASALRKGGFKVTWEVDVARADGRPGRIDLVAEYRNERVAIEIDYRSPREKSLDKLRQFRGYRIVCLRGAAHRLVGFHDRGHRPLRHDESELFLEATQALKSILDRVDPFLKDDLLRGMFELLPGKPAPMRQRPMAASAVNPAVPQQRGEQLLARLGQLGPNALAETGAHSQEYLQALK